MVNFEALKNLLTNHKVSELPLPSSITEIEDSLTVLEAMKVLVASGFLSIPVKSNGQYIGFLDLRDLVSSAVFVSNEANIVPSIEEVVSKSSKAFPVAAEGVTVRYLARRNPFKPVNLDASLLEAAKILCTGVHRVPVFDANGKLVMIASQSALMNFINKHMNLLGDLQNLEVTSLKIGTSPVIKCRDTDLALQVFEVLDKSGRSGIAVVDGEGKLVANTSGSDLKLYVAQNESLHQPIIDFLNKIRRLSLKTKAPTITCSHNDNLGHVIGRIAVTKVHRIYVVDEEHRPISVISITDILKLVR